MSFDWLNNFLRESTKAPNYAEKTLAAYRLGIKAKGSIAGVRVEIDPDGCEACRELDETAVFQPDDAPILPLAACDKGLHCQCVYRPVMKYELGDAAVSDES